MKLSDRLELVISFVEPGGTAADVGTDHGYVPIELAGRGIVSKAVAMDVREGPLSRAREHIRERGLSDRIETRLSDGVAALRAGEADTVIAAGMGGELIIHILSEGKHLWQSVKHWILSPQSEQARVREWLGANGFRIRRESMICEDGKYYVVMDAVRGAMEGLTAAETEYGPCLLRDRDPVLRGWLQREEQVTGRILESLQGQDGGGAAARRQELEKKRTEIWRLLADWQEARGGPCETEDTRRTFRAKNRKEGNS